jgi:DNA-binding SARP family transcriptional activator/tetratricopeptide (TPR) repeat protein
MSEHALTFGLLGPLEVHNAGAQIEIGSPKQRILLATLLVHSGRPIPSARLATAIWGEEQPENPRRAVQVCITRLRTLLQCGPVIVTNADGYMLDIPPDQTDLGRFRSLLREADNAAVRSDPARQSALLRKALTLWRGEPLMNVPSDMLRDEVVPHLQEERLFALERRFDLDLRLGRHVEIVSELMDLTATFALRERFWAQLMTALHRSGRRADALQTYHSARRHLAEELGIDPDDQLQQLHMTVLGYAPGVGVPPTVPRQLPAELAAFIGRRTEIARLDKFANDQDQPASVVVISGTAGVGKTALALRWSRRMADQFPDGQLWVNLRGYDRRPSVGPGAGLVLLLRALGIKDAEIPPDIDSRAGLYRSVMDGRRMLVVIDNAGTADQVRPLLPGSPSSVVLVTSRDELVGLVADGAQALRLDLFSAEEADDLLRRRLGNARIEAEPRATKEILERCARLPLALAIAAARVAQRPQLPMAVFAHQLQAALDELASADAATDIRAVFSWSYRTLSQPAARLFRLLAVHPGPDVSIDAVTSLAEVPAGSLLNELTTAHLVTEHSPGRYTMHDLLRAYVCELTQEFDSTASRRKALRHVLDHYLGMAHAAAMLIDPARDAIIPGAAPPPASLKDRAQALDWFNTEYPNLLAAITRAADRGLDHHTWQLVWCLADFQQWRGLWRDRAATLTVALAATVRLGDSAEQARAHRGLGYAYTKLRRDSDAQAHFGQALERYIALGHLAGQARVHHGLSYILERQGDHQAALWHAEQALSLYPADADKAQRGRALGTVGWCRAQLGDYPRALRDCWQTLELLRGTADVIAEGTSWDSLGYIHHHLGEHHQAISYYKNALRLRRDVGHESGVASTLTKLGETYFTQGEFDAARETWRTALVMLEQLGEPAEGIRGKLRRLGADEHRALTRPTLMKQK